MDETEIAANAQNPADASRVMEDFVFGEVMRPGAALRTYAGRLDGCLDFGLTRLLRQLRVAGNSPIILCAIGVFLYWTG